MYNVAKDNEFTKKIIDGHGHIHKEIRGNITACKIPLWKKTGHGSMRNDIIVGSDHRVTCPVCKLYIQGKDITHIVGDEK